MTVRAQKKAALYRRVAIMDAYENGTVKGNQSAVDLVDMIGGTPRSVSVALKELGFTIAERSNIRRVRTGEGRKTRLVRIPRKWAPPSNLDWPAKARLERQIVKEGIQPARSLRATRKAQSICDHGRGCFDIAALLLPQKCAIPGCRNKDIHADHIIPLSEGGLDCRDNLRPLCRSHNISKGATDPIAYARRQGMLF